METVAKCAQNQSNGGWNLFFCKHFLLFQQIVTVTGHESEDALLLVRGQPHTRHATRDTRQFKTQVTAVSQDAMYKYNASVELACLFQADLPWIL